MTGNVGRNAPCPCGSGRKFKHCCLGKPAFAAGAAGGPAETVPRWIWLATVIAVITVVALIRIRLLGVPLERDEGEYAYFGQLILQGVPPYAAAYNMKPPGVYAMYALQMLVFGQTAVGIRLGLLLVTLGSSALLFAVVARVLDIRTAALTAAAQAWLAVSPTVLGFAGHATHFIVLFAVLGAWFLERAVRRERWVDAALSGIAFALAVLMKPQAVFFGVAAGAVLLAVGWQRRRHDSRALLSLFAAYAAGAVGTVAACWAMMGICGVFDRFWFWTVTYALAYGSGVPLEQAWPHLCASLPRAARGWWLLWALAGIGIVVGTCDRRLGRRRLVLAAFLAASAAAVLPGFYFRPHYFLVMLPALGCGAAVGVTSGMPRLARLPGGRVLRYLPFAVWGVAMIVPAVVHADVLFERQPNDVSRAVYGLNPFVESPGIAEFIRTRTAPGDTIAVLGSEPQIYFYSRRRAATGYIYTYALMETHDHAAEMQREMIAEIEAADPKIVVFVSVSTSWLARAGSSRLLLDWYARVIPERYRRVGVCDLVSRERTVTVWGEQAATYAPRSRTHVLVFEKNPKPPSEATEISPYRRRQRPEVNLNGGPRTHGIENRDSG